MVFHLAHVWHMKILLTAFLFLALVFQGMCQKQWTYQECAKYAQEHNIELNNSQLQVEQQRVFAKDAKNDLLPNISGFVGYGINQGRSVDPNTNTYVESEFFNNSYEISGSMNLFNGFRKQNRISFEKYNLSAEEEAYEARKNQLNYDVLEAYINYQVDKGLIEIIGEQKELSERELDRITKFIELGRAAGSEKYEVEARLANDEFLLIQQQNRANLSLLELKRLMNYPIDSSLVTEELRLFEGVDPNITLDSMFDQAKANLPRMKSLTNRLNAAEKQVKMAQATLYPSLDLYANYSTRYSDTFVEQNGDVISFNDQFKNNQSLNYGLGLAIPLFDAFSRRNQIQVTKIAREQAVNNYKTGLQNLEYEIYQVQLEWHAAISEYLSAVKREQSEETALEAATRRREKGLISVMEYYEARNNSAIAQAEILRTSLQTFLKERTVNFYLTGTLLD